MAVRTPAEAVKASCVQIPGFEHFLSNAKSRGVEFAVFRGKTNLAEKELEFSGEVIFALLRW
jgi:predicted phage tail protein